MKYRTLSDSIVIGIHPSVLHVTIEKGDN